MRTCVNACVFCFMTMLPKGGRSTLYIRDDDYRLSFLQGNFVTLTNLTDEDVQNVIQRNMSPMNVSVHAVSPRRPPPHDGPQRPARPWTYSRPSWPPASRFTRKSCCAPA